MTQEQRELLLKDLCARLPHGVNIQYDNGHVIETRELGLGSLHDFIFNDVAIKPYLRPISTMTEEEQLQLGRLLGATSYNLLKGEYSSLKELLEYVYKNHIDLFGLIPKGLAIEAPEDMYKID